MTLEQVFTLIALILAFIGLIYTAIQIRGSRKVSLADFLLKLDDHMREHDEVHLKLRPGGEWIEPGEGPKTNEEWVKVERYMGLFERIQILVRMKILPLKIVKNLYGYRVGNIVSNSTIYDKKIKKRGKYWKDFIDLAKSLKYIHKHTFIN